MGGPFPFAPDGEVEAVSAVQELGERRGCWRANDPSLAQRGVFAVRDSRKQRIVELKLSDVEQSFLYTPFVSKTLALTWFGPGSFVGRIWVFLW